MFPTNVIDTLTMTVTDAADLAAEGQLADGSSALLARLQRAEEIAEEGVEWSAKLVARWRLACENYARQYGTRVE